MNRILTILTSLFCAHFLSATAIPDMKFRRLDTRDGLSNSQVNCIFKDSEGFVWIGTPYGLNRYDGYRFRVFFSNANDTTTIKDNYVDDICEAYDGRLWIKQGMNYCVYNPVTERFDRRPDRWLARQGIKGGIDRIYIDSRKCFWVKTYENGLYYFNPYTRKLHLFKHGRGRNDIPEGFGVSSFSQFRNSVLVASTKGEIVCFNGEEGRVSWRNSYMRRHGGREEQGYSLYVDRQCNYWVVTTGQTFVYIQKQKKWYSSLPQLLRSYGIEHVPDEIQVWDVNFDTKGRLWMATDHLGLLVADLKAGQMRRFTNDKNDETSISDITVKRLYRDRLGKMWVGSYKNGVNQYTENLSNFKSVELGDVNTVAEDHTGNYWLGTNDRGIICYDPVTGRQACYNKESGHLAVNVIVSSYVARDGSIWFGTYGGGLLRYAGGRFEAYRATGAPGSLINNNVWAITEDQWGNLWIGTLGGGIQRMDAKTGKMETYNTKTSILTSDYISSIQLNRKGWIMAGTSDYYVLINPANRKVINCSIPQAPDAGAVAPATSQVVLDSRGLVWQGSVSGMAVYDARNKRVKLLDMKSGFYGTSVCSVIEDTRRTMWVVTDYGISNVIPQRQDDGTWNYTVRSYNSRDGLQQGPFNQRSACITRSGLLVVGGQSGIDIINPLCLGQGKTQEVPVFSGLVLFDREIVAGARYDGRVVLGEALNTCRRLVLNHDENQFTIQLASNSGSIHNRTRFVYQIKGFSDKWIKTEENNPNISFMSLSPGDYDIRVKMLNDDGTVGTAEAALRLTIRPPHWRSWWALLLYALLLSAAVRYVWRCKQRRLLEQQRRENIRREEEKKHEISRMKKDLLDNLTKELGEPFSDTFEALNDIMSNETDEQRYEKEQAVYSGVERLLTQANEVLKQGGKRHKLSPQIEEVEVTSLDEKLVNDATKYVESNLDKADISVETMSEAMGMSRVHLYKRLLSVTGMTPSEFIRRIRLMRAEQLLRKSQLTVSEVSYQVGFNNPRYFSKYFKEMYGVMPSQYAGSAHGAPSPEAPSPEAQ